MASKPTLNRSIAEELNEYGYKIPKTKGDFGLEIETEVLGLYSYPKGSIIQIPQNGHHLWDFPGLPEFKGHEDGSLRNFGVEFVLRNPMSYEDTDRAVAKFGEVFGGVPFMKDSPGTSVHVHINLAKHSWCTLGNFLTAYSLVENLLSVFAGPTRTSNLFALPLRCAEDNHTAMVDIFTGIEAGRISGVQKLSDESHKYAAMNLAPLYRLGSVESRLMRGVTDADTIRLWLRILNELLEFSKLRGLTPRDILEEYHSNGNFLELLFPETHESLPQDYSMITSRSVFYAAWLADCVQDWKSLSLPGKPASKKSRGDIGDYLTLAEINATPTIPWTTIGQAIPAAPQGILSGADLNALTMEANDTEEDLEDDFDDEYDDDDDGHDHPDQDFY